MRCTRYYCLQLLLLLLLKKANITTTTKNYYYYYDYCLQLPRICMMRHAHKKDSAHGKPFARHHNKDRHRKREGGFRV